MLPADASSGGDSERPPGRKARRIVLFTLDALPSAVAMPILLDGLEGRVVAIVSSRRFGGRHGGVTTQFLRSVRRSGVAFTAYLALHTVIYRPAAMVAAAVARLLGRAADVRRLGTLARDRAIPVIETAEPHASEVVERLRALSPDLFISLHFDRIIRAPLLALPVHGTINVHPGALPELRGPFPVFWAILRGHTRFTVTVHRIESETLDTGPVLAAREVPDDPAASVLAMDCRLMVEAATLALDAVRDWERNVDAARSQDETRAVYDTFPTAEAVRALAHRGRRLFSVSDFIAVFQRRRSGE